VTLDLFGYTSTADFSPCRTYRYSLTRRWGEGPAMLVVGLNPSTADETLDDQTIRKCVGYARREGLAALTMTNLFAYRATNPDVMKVAADPIGPANDATLERLAGDPAHQLVVAAWGVHGAHMGRAADVLARGLLGPRIHALRVTKDGYPWHPLYLPASAPLRRYP
jgi:hypothetical protein